MCVQYKNVYFFKSVDLVGSEDMISQAAESQQHIILTQNDSNCSSPMRVTALDTLRVGPGDLLGQEGFLKHFENAGFQCLTIR